MRPKKHEATGEGDLFRARLDQIINMKHELVQLAAKIEWAWIDGEIAPLYSDKGRPGIESRFVIGLLLLKHMFGLSDEGVCERWVAAQEHRLPNRRQAAACDDQGAQSLGSPPWRAAAAILSARRQAGGDDGGALCPRQAVQPPPSRGALPAHPPGSADPRYPPQDQGHGPVEAAFESPLSRASQIRSQRQRQRGWKLYSFHAREVECIGKGKARAP